MEVSKKSWHFRLYNWFNEGKLPRIIDLCSYCRTVMFWAPLKVIFYFPALWLHKKSKLLSYLILIFLVGAIDAVLIRTFPDDGWTISYVFTLAIFYLFYYHPGLKKTVASDWKEGEETKFVRYTKQTGRVIETGFKYSVGWPLKTIFWTIWVKMYDFHKALFWSVLCLVLAAIFYGLYLVGWWWKALLGIAIFAIIMLLIYLLGSFFEGKWLSIKNSLVWQFLVAKKRKICPFIESRD